MKGSIANNHSIPDDLFQSWRSRVQQAIERKELSLERVSVIRRKSLTGPFAIGYDEFGWEHLYAFFLANYLKTRLACRHFGYRPKAGEDLHIIDLGAGAGPGSAGLVDYLRYDIGYLGQIVLVAIDLSGTQLRLFEDISAPHLTAEKVEFSMVKEDCLSFTVNFSGSLSLILASYLFSELEESKRHRLAIAVASMICRSGGDLMVVDDTDSKIITQLNSLIIWPSVRNITRKKVVIPNAGIPGDRHFKTTFTLTAGLYGGLTWVEDPAVPLPNQLFAYKQAWERHDISVIRELFDPVSEYEIRPERILHGADEISDYWKKNKSVQRAVRFRVLRWAFSGNVILAEWEAKFMRLDLGRKLHLEGSMRMELRNGKVTRFCEFFSRKESSLI